MYSPPPFGSNADTLDEYLELRNFSSQTVPLFDPLHATNAWRLDGGVQFTFPLGVTMAAGSYLLVVNFDPLHDPVMLNWFRSRYSVDVNTPLYGPYQGNLDNSGERIGLYLPDKPELPPASDAGFVPYVLVEEVHYSPLPPWPAGADGTGNSLQRIASAGFADDPANWSAGAPTAGRLNQSAGTADADHDGLPDEWELANGLDPSDPNGDNGPLGDPDHDGFNNLQEYLAGSCPTNALDALRFATVGLATNRCLLQFNTHTGITYSVQKLRSLGATNAWTTLQDNIPGTGAPYTATDPLATGACYYRLKAMRSP